MSDENQIQRIEAALASIEPNKIIRPILSKHLQKYSCGCVGNRGHCLTHVDGEIDFIQPCNYKGGFVTAIHDVPIKAEQTAEPLSTMMMIALHRCTKDEHGFITAMERLPLTELYPVEQMHIQGSDYEQAWEKIVPPMEHTAFRGDFVTIFEQMREGLLVDKL